MSEEIKWLIGAAIAVGGFVISLIGLDRRTMKAIDSGDKELHSRVNRLNEMAVKKGDLNSHLQPIHNSMKELREDQRETNRLIRELISKPKP